MECDGALEVNQLGYLGCSSLGNGWVAAIQCQYCPRRVDMITPTDKLLKNLLPKVRDSDTGREVQIFLPLTGIQV